MGERFHPYRRLITDRFFGEFPRQSPGRRALDLGCGTGAMALRLAAAGFETLGVDHSPEMLAIARADADARGLEDGLELRIGDVTALDVEDDSVDLVTCQGVLHHLAATAPAVAEMARVLRPGGLFYIAEPTVGSSLAIRLWDRYAAGRLTAHDHHRDARGGGTAPTPEHDEGLIDAAALSAELDGEGLEHDLHFFPYLDGLHRIRPAPLQSLIFHASSRPWRNRSGTLGVFFGRRPAWPSAPAGYRR